MFCFRIFNRDENDSMRRRFFDQARPFFNFCKSC